MSLRVLDVGCADGAFAHMLHQELGRGVAVVDGIDPDGVILERARERGLPGTFAQGTADDLGTEKLHGGDVAAFERLRAIERGSYDAVVAFEVIEHVPDMAEFLGRLEAMLKPGGVIYLSTPEGCFGLGNNPHHLRALRPVDLADLLRRRGELVNMTVGGDGVTVASYRPGPRPGPEWSIFAPSPTAWSPADIEGAGLGGSETAATRLAEELSDAGRVVTVYGEVDDTAWKTGVLMRNQGAYDPLAPVDVQLVSRAPQVFERPSRARTRALWVHDVDCGDALTPQVADRLDAVLCLSTWHHNHLLHRYPFLEGKLAQVRNGIHGAYFEGPELTRRKRVVYSSSPDRGLDVLLKLWPQVLAEVPDAELTYCYSPVYWQMAAADERLGQFTDGIQEATAEFEGVTCEDALPQQALAMLMRESMVWAHPSYSTPGGTEFHETSCIGAMEAQAAGLHVVASNWGALPETVRCGALVDGPALGEKWERAFVKEIVRGLTAPMVAKRAQHNAADARLFFSWQGAAEAIATALDG